MKTFVYLALAGAAVAQERPVWVATDELRYPDGPKQCSFDADCTPDHVCLQHMWSHAGMKESAQGCWHVSVCQNDGAWLMFDDNRNLQYFCKDSHKEAAYKFEWPEYAIRPSSKGRHWDEYQEACYSDADCEGVK